MEEALAPIGRFIMSLVRYFVVELIVDRILYGVGFSVLKLVSLGTYPRSPVSRQMKNHCLFAGVATFTIAIVLIAVFNGFS
ncbi:hypothetical protein [Thalassotalea euphylliae]|uniref:Uncharacterized protein n=1 Tax=Thalassotalea euphylliae TaxID=1655234 RepID=A0A3E0UEM0_9GAMM|nr:hypothetical protein [Thalassotalea euphylliae]REL35023.1 hypothetical protein DXX92_06380 [Thalassotalea euphylliae]